MSKTKSLWNSWKNKSSNLSRWLLPVAVCFLELLFHFWVGGSVSLAALLNLMGFSCGACRLPLWHLDEGKRAVLCEELRKFSLLA